MKKNIITLIILILSVSNGFAQQSIDPVIEVNKDFDGKLININKSTLNPFINDSLSTFDVNFKYSFFNTPYKGMFEFIPLPSSQINNISFNKSPFLMAKIGAGSPTQINGDIWGSYKNFMINGFYNLFNGNIPELHINDNNIITKFKGNNIKAPNNQYGINSAYEYNWEKGSFNINLNYNGGYYSYYGFNKNPIPKHYYNQINTNFNLKSTYTPSNKFTYWLNAEYARTHDRLPDNNSKITENFFNIKGEFGPNFGKYTNFSLFFGAKNANYINARNDSNFHHTIIEIAPMYKYENNRIVTKVGIKFSGKTNNFIGKNKNFSPLIIKASVLFEAIENYLWLNAEIDGWNNLNNYSALFENNKWISPTNSTLDAIKESSTPFWGKIGINGKVTDTYSYQIYATYGIHKGLLQYVTTKTALLPYYSNSNQFSIGANFLYKTESFKGGFNIEYSKYTKGNNKIYNTTNYPFGYPPFKGEFFGEYNLKKRIYIGFNTLICSSTPTGIISSNNLINDYNVDVKMANFINLGVNAKYVINKIFTIYLEGNNLLNSPIQLYPFYCEKGINFLGGVIIKLYN